MAEEFVVKKTEAEWRELLGVDAYRVLRQQGTEPPFTNAYNAHVAPGVYLCGACGQELFDSEAKYNSGSGWPSFYEPLTPNALGETLDKRFGMERREIHCSRCGSHIGHVFPDGPQPTGLRYCTNSAALKFKNRAASE